MPEAKGHRAMNPIKTRARMKSDLPLVDGEEDLREFDSPLPSPGSNGEDEPAGFDAETKGRTIDGVVAYSAICPHTGCDVTNWHPDKLLLE